MALNEGHTLPLGTVTSEMTLYAVSPGATISSLDGLVGQETRGEGSLGPFP